MTHTIKITEAQRTVITFRFIDVDDDTITIDGNAATFREGAEQWVIDTLENALDIMEDWNQFEAQGEIRATRALLRKVQALS